MIFFNKMLQTSHTKLKKFLKTTQTLKMTKLKQKYPNKGLNKIKEKEK